MADLHQVSIDTSNDAPQPTLEELATQMDEQASPPADTPQEGERPEWLPAKFKSVEEMAKAYSALEQKLGSGKPQEAPEKPAESEEEDPAPEVPEDPEEAQEQAQEAADKAGLDLGELSNKYFDNGKLDDSDYEALDKAGYPRHLVDQFIRGQEAVASQMEAQVFSSVGGQETYQEMLTWASDELSEGEIRAFNKAVNSGDMDEVLTAVKGLNARYTASVGFEPSRRVNGQAKQTDNVYRSVAEVQRDMADPRYKQDSAFRKDVEAKLGRSDIF